jgi:hypothetical protein
MPMGRALSGVLVHRGQVFDYVFLLAVILEVHVESGLDILHVASEALPNALPRLDDNMRKVNAIPVWGPHYPLRGNDLLGGCHVGVFERYVPTLVSDKVLLAGFSLLALLGRHLLLDL